MEPALARKILVSTRAAVGWSSLLFPRLVLRVSGVRGELPTDLRHTVRLLGVREALLSYQLYQAQRHGAPEDELEESLRQQVLVGALDTVAGVVAGCASRMRGRVALGAVTTSLATTCLALLGRERGNPSPEGS